MLFTTANAILSGKKLPEKLEPNINQIGVNKVFISSLNNLPRIAYETDIELPSAVTKRAKFANIK